MGWVDGEITVATPSVGVAFVHVAPRHGECRSDDCSRAHGKSLRDVQRRSLLARGTADMG
jgi:hypothetical protein